MRNRLDIAPTISSNMYSYQDSQITNYSYSETSSSFNSASDTSVHNQSIYYSNSSPQTSHYQPQYSPFDYYNTSSLKRQVENESDERENKKPRLQKLPDSSDPSAVYTCYSCVKNFNSASKFLMHYHKSHLGRDPLECPICRKLFSIFLESIIDLTPFFHLDKTFGSRANVTVHIKAHTQEKEYKCVYCDKSFCDSSTLKKHKRTHTGEKPYECEYCHKRFTQSGNLKRHVQNVHSTVEQPTTSLTSSYYNTQIPQNFNFNSTYLPGGYPTQSYFYPYPHFY